MKRLCTICARGGSKGVPQKNIKSLLGKPLILHTIEVAQATGLFDCIAVSSDCDNILEVARQGGVDLVIKRPDHMASDTAGKVDAIIHAQGEAEKFVGYQFDTHVDLDATAPLRLVDDVRKGVDLLEETGVKSVISACQARHNPYFNMVEIDSDGVVRYCSKAEKPFLRRQDAPDCYDINASIYVWNRDAFLADPKVFYGDTRILVMPEVRSVDVDAPFDWFIVEQTMKAQLHLDGVSYEAPSKASETTFVNAPQSLNVSTPAN